MNEAVTQKPAAIKALKKMINLFTDVFSQEEIYHMEKALEEIIEPRKVQRSKDTLHEIRDSVNIVNVIQRDLDLKKRGRNLIAKCPFHDDNTPSFSVNEEMQRFNCFGCGKRGDVIQYLQNKMKWSIPETLRYLKTL